MDYFPQALASGDAFCNRIDEQEHLLYNIQECKPSLIVSPRRYGKTSLALQVIKKTKLPHAQFDFLAAVSINDVESIILKGIGQLLGKLEKGPKKLLRIATELFSGLSIRLNSDAIGLSLELNKKSQNPASHILSILERVEELAEKYKTPIVLLFDEFQRVYEASKNHAVESIIRQVAQASKHVSFIFSGSNRHLLNTMFNDRNRPFYNMCDRITLQRISENDYINHINKVAKKTQKSLSKNSCHALFDLTERHPYYMNLLCSRIWRKSTATINSKVIEKAWTDYAFEERSQVACDLDSLTLSQRKLLAALARSNGTKAPRGHEFLSQAGMPSTTIKQSLEYLEKRDYVYLTQDGTYKVLDPVIKYILSEG